MILEAGFTPKPLTNRLGFRGLEGSALKWMSLLLETMPVDWAMGKIGLGFRDIGFRAFLFRVWGLRLMGINPIKWKRQRGMSWKLGLYSGY